MRPASAWRSRPATARVAPHRDWTSGGTTLETDSPSSKLTPASSTAFCGSPHRPRSDRGNRVAPLSRSHRCWRSGRRRYLASASAGHAPHDRAVLAAITGAATGNDARWHDALALALDHGLRLLAVDALEGLAIGASRSESCSGGLRLLGAAERL